VPLYALFCPDRFNSAARAFDLAANANSWERISGCLEFRGSLNP